MYDELIKWLWECASGECFNCSQYTPTTNASICQKELMKQAADAIEELSMRLHGDEAAIAGMKREIERMVVADKPRWIPVTERLPDKDGRYLVSYPLFNVEAWMRVAYFSTDLHRTNEYAFLGKKYKRPGFYYSDDEYGDAELEDITHWMPLPEPPKEGKP